MIKLKNLLEREETDVKFRDEAKRILKDLIKVAKTKKKSFIEAEKGYLLPAEMIDKKYKNLHFIFVSPDVNDKFEMKTLGSYKGMIIPLLTDENPLENLPKLLKRYDTSFIHEFIHYLDSLRLKGKDPKYTSGELSQLKGDKAYYNTPTEFNAYYQEGAEVLMRNLKRLSKDFKTFVKKDVPRYFDKDFLENMNSKYRKHFIKRLADFHGSRVND